MAVTASDCESVPTLGFEFVASPQPPHRAKRDRSNWPNCLVDAKRSRALFSRLDTHQKLASGSAAHAQNPLVRAFNLFSTTAKRGPSLAPFRRFSDRLAFQPISRFVRSSRIRGRF